MSLEPAQCRMARVALEMGIRDLAKIADVSPNTIARLERGDTLHARTQAFIRGALEAEGVIFIEHGTLSFNGGAGVRLGDGPKSRYADLFERLWTLPDLRREPNRSVAALTDVFALYLDIIDEEGREPDVWERLDLNGALNGLVSDNPHLAFACLRRGITPPDNQSPDYPIRAEDARQAEALNLAYFRRCLAQLRARHPKAGDARAASPSGAADGFKAQGFLSAEIDAFRRSVREWAPAKPWFELADELNRLGLELLKGHQTPLHDNQRLSISALFVRTHQSHQAALILAERGMIGDARSVLRSAVESAIALHALAADGKFVDRLVDAYRLNQQKLARVVLNNQAYRASYGPEQISQMELTVQEVEYLKSRRGTPPREINWADVAQQHCPDLYQLLYRLLSADGTHTTVDTINRFLASDAKQNIVALKGGPDADGVVEVLTAACLVMLWGVEPFSRAFPVEGLDDRIQELVQRFTAISAPVADAKT